MMLQGKSLLNPHATPYIPLSEKSGISSEGENKAARKTLGVSGNSETVGKTAGDQIPDAAVEYNIQSLGKLHVSDESSSEMGQPCYSYNDTFHDETSATEKQSLFDDPNQIMESLSAMFPDISIESLAALFNANHGDMNDTIDMLELLEYEGDVSEIGNNLDSAVQKSNSSRTSSSSI